MTRPCRVIFFWIKPAILSEFKILLRQKIPNLFFEF